MDQNENIRKSIIYPAPIGGIIFLKWRNNICQRTIYKNEILF